LLLAQKIAGAPDVEVVAGKLESSAQRIEGLQHLEPSFGRAGQRLVGVTVKSA
jgi:hypothetical protein